MPEGNPSRGSPTADRAWHAARALADRSYLTVSDVLPTTLPDVPLIVVLPILTVVARPPDVIVATLVADEVQVTELVKFWLLPSV